MAAESSPSIGLTAVEEETTNTACILAGVSRDETHVPSPSTVSIIATRLSDPHSL